MKNADLCRITGETPRSLRYLVTNGFMPPPVGQTSSAEYRDEHVQAVHRYQTMRSAGLTVSALRDIVQGRGGGGPVVFAVSGGTLSLDADPRDVDPVRVAGEVEAVLRALRASVPSPSDPSPDVSGESISSPRS